MRREAIQLRAAQSAKVLEPKDPDPKHYAAIASIRLRGGPFMCNTFLWDQGNRQWALVHPSNVYRLLWAKDQHIMVCSLNEVPVVYPNGHFIEASKCPDLYHHGSMSLRPFDSIQKSVYGSGCRRERSGPR